MRQFTSRWPNSVVQLANAGFSTDDAYALRRISMTLHRWHELECGDGNDYGSWAIVRGHKGREPGPVTAEHSGGFRATFDHDDEGEPYLEHHHYMHGRGKDSVSYTKLADKERGALKRLAKIMARYPGFASYVQGDPRGCALYIMRPGDVREGDTLDSCYNRGIAVHK